MADKRGTGRPIPPVFLPCCLPSGRWRWKIGSRGTIDACCESRWKIAPGILRPRSHANGCARAFFLSRTLVGRRKKGHRRTSGASPLESLEQDFRKYFSCVTSFPFSGIEQMHIFVSIRFSFFASDVVVYGFLAYFFSLFLFFVN